ncbi:hypothetical protein FXV83_27990 [Bradyrhizobium hipponense]|uniref:Uncharacterized protein n=1 Tax=Bradyrhizobium hipponense TaxID=2605638 RepID=A0A5S4YFZ7_9BRAD|nr:hypothetical protein [Bradyrhizobium hipponense]TYO63326.1 hypothetical protein FXV83_27990 [Bradyrhizobium hipponense]
MKVFKWRSSLAFWLPKKLIEKVVLGKGNYVHVASADEQTPGISDSDFLRRLRALQRPRPGSFVWNRDDASAR